MLTNILLHSAMAFEVQRLETGEEMYWGEMPVSYAWIEGEVPAGLGDVAAQIDASYAAWAAVQDAYVSVNAESASGPPAVALDDGNLVFFTSDWPAGNEALAITTTWTNESGAIVQYDIRINATIPWSVTGAPDAFDLQAAMTHEVGHVLGFDHTPVEDATMFAKHEFADVHRRELHADDRAAAQYLYGAPPAPAEPADTGEAPPSGGLACNATSFGPSGGGWPALGLLLFLRRRGDRC